MENFSKVSSERLKVDSNEVLLPHKTDSGGSDKNFVDLLKESIERVNENQIQADRAIKEAIAGRNKNIHETLLTIEKAELSLKMMMQVRNKILDAYKEVMKMPV